MANSFNAAYTPISKKVVQRRVINHHSAFPIQPFSKYVYLLALTHCLDNQYLHTVFIAFSMNEDIVFIIVRLVYVIPDTTPQCVFSSLYRSPEYLFCIFLDFLF